MGDGHYKTQNFVLKHGLDITNYCPVIHVDEKSISTAKHEIIAALLMSELLI